MSGQVSDLRSFSLYGGSRLSRALTHATYPAKDNRFFRLPPICSAFWEPGWRRLAIPLPSDKIPALRSRLLELERHSTGSSPARTHARGGSRPGRAARARPGHHRRIFCLVEEWVSIRAPSRHDLHHKAAGEMRRRGGGTAGDPRSPTSGDVPPHGSSAGRRRSGGLRLDPHPWTRGPARLIKEPWSRLLADTAFFVSRSVLGRSSRQEPAARSAAYEAHAQNSFERRWPPSTALP